MSEEWTIANASLSVVDHLMSVDESDVLTNMTCCSCPVNQLKEVRTDAII